MSATQIRQSEGPFFKEPRQFKKYAPNGFPIGKRTVERQKQNAKLNKLKIKVCELRLPGVCIGNRMLSWAHSQKSRFITTDKDWQEAARSCCTCHDALDSMPHSEMKRLVREAISKRNAALWNNYEG